MPSGSIASQSMAAAVVTRASIMSFTPYMQQKKSVDGRRLLAPRYNINGPRWWDGWEFGGGVQAREFILLVLLHALLWSIRFSRKGRNAKKKVGGSWYTESTACVKPFDKHYSLPYQRVSSIMTYGHGKSRENLSLFDIFNLELVHGIYSEVLSDLVVTSQPLSL